MSRVLAAVCIGAPLVPVEPARAAEKPPAAAPKLDFARLQRTLEAGDETAQLAALAELEAAPKESAARAAALVDALLGRGATLRVLERGLEAERTLAQPASSAAVAPYVRHRHPKLRHAAARALGATGGPLAVTALRGALRGSDGDLRRHAATALASLKATDAVPELFAVLNKDVPEAARAIGELCAPADCAKLADQLGKLPFDVMRAGLEPILLRPETSVPEEQKLDLLERLRKLQTQEASAFLKSVRARYPKDGSARVRAGLEAAASGRPVTK